MDSTPQLEIQAVVPDVAAALIEIINLSRPKSGSLHRNLKLSLAQLIAEIGSPGVVQVLSQRRDPFKTVLQKVAFSLEELLSSDYLESRYLDILEKENRVPSLPFSFFRVGFWAGGNKYLSPTERIDEILCRPFPTLHLFRDLVQSCNVQNIELEELLNGDTHVKELNSRVQRWNSLVDKIYDSTDLKDLELDEAEVPKPPMMQNVFDREDSVHHLSQALYDVLHKNWPCDSQNHNHNGRLGLCMEAKFCLDPQWTGSHQSNDNFLMLLTGPNIMQECRVCVNRSSSDDNAAPACLIDHDDQSRSVCLYLAMDGDNQLWNNQRSARPVEIMMAGELYVEMSLSKLLTIVKPTYSAKRVMGVTLARSILHLFEGPWLDGCMSIDDIYVYCKIENNQPYPVFDKVFVATRFENQSKKDLTSSGKYKIHPFPTILALGIILIELELGEELPDIKSNPVFESKRGQPFYLARYLLKEFQRHFTLDSGLIRAVKFCIDRASFSRFDTLDSEALLYSQDFIDTYYNNIVRPLEQDLVKGAHWTWEQVDDLRPPNTDTGVCKVFTSKTFEFSQTTASDLAGVQFTSSNTRLGVNGQGTHDVIRGSRWSASLSTNSARLIPQEVPIRSKPTRSATCTIEQERSFFTQKRVLSAVSEIQLCRPGSREDFEIAIICALQIEANAVQNIFEEHWDIDSVYDYGKQPNDPNSYSTGSIGRHHVILAHQPRMGKATAAKVAATCSMSFPNLKLILIVGVCGGVPFARTKKEILLGDVVISKGIVQYDFGRRNHDGFRPKATIDDQPGRPDIEISSLIARLETKRHQLSLRENIAAYLDELDCGSDAPDDIYPGHKQDKLFGSEYIHKHQESQIKPCIPCLTGVCNLAMGATCEDLQCDQQQLIPRFRQNQRNRPYVHFGLIASGDTVLKSAPERDRISKDANVIAFEMEGSGVWDTIPCMIIKGVCDYADSHKNKRWQEYAAMTAAATAKAILRHWAVSNQSRNVI
ncbi:hypothetical protein N7493_002555 [Penicillium malachiteum]|uniref:Nucleoside phosphorylase domain-containing protein n=1 Tax=Penicillium malachiteum TaxID=1324776 RepID=A0AAD6HT49_9EURO|nr:hypothetical protein N7493_002555 [Penicillium malachiteum]